MDQIHFYGHSKRVEVGRALGRGAQEALMMAYDVVIPAYVIMTKNTKNLWL